MSIWKGMEKVILNELTGELKRIGTARGYRKWE
jgi:hypothetical protein